MHHLVPHLAIAPGAYGLVGMGAVFAAARAPISALLIMRDVTVRDATGRAPRALSPNQPLSEVIAQFAAERSDSLPVLEAVQALAATEDDGIPVLAPDEAHIVGWLTHRRLLRTYRTHAAVNGRGWRHWR